MMHSRKKKVTKVSTEFNDETGVDEEYKYTTTVSKFDPRTLKASKLGEEFIYNFCETYNINNTVGTKLKLKSLNNKLI